MTIEEQILERGAIRDKQQVLIRLLEKKFGHLDNDNVELTRRAESSSDIWSAVFY